MTISLEILTESKTCLKHTFPIDQKHVSHQSKAASPPLSFSLDLLAKSIQAINYLATFHKINIARPSTLFCLFTKSIQAIKIVKELKTWVHLFIQFHGCNYPRISFSRWKLKWVEWLVNCSKTSNS